MTKRTKKEKQEPNYIVFLVEGESDKIALDIPLANLVYDKYPEYEVRFLLQERLIDSSGEEVNDTDSEDDVDEDEIIDDQSYEYGGDVTSSYFVYPSNIEAIITNRFIKPATRTEGIYPKKIAKVIQIVDLDGTFISSENVVPLSEDNQDKKVFYDAENGLIEAENISSIIKRNEWKSKNIDYLLNLPDQKIKIGPKKIPYEIYFFSSNLDHFINKDANIEFGKKQKADSFLKKYGFNQNDFCSFFLNDEKSIGHMGYKESWEFIKQKQNSIYRYSNLDFLIRSLISK